MRITVMVQDGSNQYVEGIEFDEVELARLRFARRATMEKVMRAIDNVRREAGVEELKDEGT